MGDKIFNISNNTLFIIRSFESNKRQRSINSIDQCTQSLLEKQKNRIIPFFANEWKIHRFQFSRTRKMRQKFIRISREKNPSIKLNLARIVIEPLPEILPPEISSYNACTSGVVELRANCSKNFHFAAQSRERNCDQFRPSIKIQLPAHVPRLGTREERVAHRYEKYPEFHQLTCSSSRKNNGSSKN